MSSSFCRPRGADILGASFVPIHAFTALAFLAAAIALSGILLSTRPLRVAFLSRLSAGPRRLCADGYATTWVLAALLCVCGLNQALLVSASLGAPYLVQVVATVLRAGVLAVAAGQLWRMWRGIGRRAP